MRAFHSKVDVGSEAYLNNHKQMLGITNELHERLSEALSEGLPVHIERHKKQGKYLARERLDMLLDQDSPFLELMPLAGFEQEDMTLGGSVVCGIGLVCGVECMVGASIATIKGGSANEATLQKLLRAQQIATENGLPNICLLESGGANLNQQFKVFHLGGGFFRGLTVQSKLGVPTITVVLGTCTAGGAYHPGMSDYIIMVKNQLFKIESRSSSPSSHPFFDGCDMFLAGPPLVKMATGEEIDDETLGGVSDFLANDELHAVQIAREIVHTLNFQKKTPLPSRCLSADIEEPLYPAEEILGIVSADIRIPFDSKELIARIVDGSRFMEFKKSFGPTLVTCFAHIHGIPIGILANNGVLFSDASNKGAHFIQICNKRNIPILFLHNITGFMVGSHYEQEGMIKHGSKLINAVSNSGVPHISLVTGASYGAGNYGMCGRAYKPRFLFAYPNAKVAVMGSDQLVGTMDIIQRQAAKKAGKAIDEEKATMIQSMAKEQLERESSAYYCSSRVLDDGIIDPRDTRTIVGICLSIVYSEIVRGTEAYGISRM